VPLDDRAPGRGRHPGVVTERGPGPPARVVEAFGLPGALAPAKATDRAATLANARAATPERFTSSTPPKILQLPDAAWINPPLLPAEPAA